MEFSGCNLYTGIYTVIQTKDGIITSIEEMKDRPVLDSDPILSRGFVDAQVNGYRGVDYSGVSLTEEKILSLIEDLAQTGTLRHIPTIITNSQERIEENLTIIKKAVAHNARIRHAIAGIHIEGPYISKDDGPRGAHDPLFVRDPNIRELRSAQKAAGGLIKLVTIAPEREGSLGFIKEARNMGIAIALGHCNPTPEQIQQSVEAGASISTHLGNGSHALLPRLKNHIWEQLANDHLYAGIISDGFHLPESVLKVYLRAKGLSKLFLVSDVALLGGYDSGIYRWGNIEVEVFADGHLGLPGSPYLAGAGHLLDWDIPHFRNVTGSSLLETVSLATTNPVVALDLGGDTGNFAVGQSSDLICFKDGVRRLQVLSYSHGIYEEVLVYHERRQNNAKD